MRLRGSHPALTELPEEAVLTLALNEFGNNPEGKGDLSALAKHCGVIIQVALKSGVLEKGSDGEVNWTELLPVIPIMAKLWGSVMASAKKRDRKLNPMKEIQLSNNQRLHLDVAVLSVLENGMSAGDVLRKFAKKGWSVGNKRADRDILAVLRSAPFCVCVGAHPERFDLTAGGVLDQAKLAKTLPQEDDSSDLQDALDRVYGPYSADDGS
jgi:hypothetical protein